MVFHGQNPLIVLLIVLLMLVHLIRPLGLPGLKKRSDFWKISLAALGAFALTAVFSHFG